MVRRPLGARPLLVASAGLSLVMGCSGGKNAPEPPVGNLMMPTPTTEQVCVDVTPATASVTIDGVQAEGGCATIDPGDRVHIEVSADGYTTETRDVPSESLQGIAIALTPIDAGAGEPPTGNMVAPPPVP